MGSATLPPWLAPWSTGLVYGARVYRGAADRRRPQDARHRPRLTIYTYSHANDVPVISTWGEDGSGAVPLPGAAGLEAGQGEGGSAAPPAPAPAPAVRWERVPLDREPWHVDVPVPLSPHSLDRAPPFDHSAVEYGAAAGGGEALRAWGGVLRGWAAGATLLALLVVVVRLGERFLDWKILLRRRRLHREWQRANVRATSRPEGALPGEGGECAVEMPPPYSECTAQAPKDEPRREEPPPPYSACVQFIHKHDAYGPPHAAEQCALAGFLRAHGMEPDPQPTVCDYEEDDEEPPLSCDAFPRACSAGTGDGGNGTITYYASSELGANAHVNLPPPAASSFPEDGIPIEYEIDVAAALDADLSLTHEVDPSGADEALQDGSVVV